MNDIVSKTYCVILAGGKGRRLWPCSREDHPKQFIDFFGTGKTQLQQTYERMARILPLDHIYVNTNNVYAHLVKEQLPDLSPENLLSEPIYRNTAPSIAWATFRVFQRDKGATLIVVPSDQDVHNEEKFIENIHEGIGFIGNNDGILALGVKPTRPEPGYGYIQLGEEVGKDLYKAKSFTEKPEREFAKLFMESGEFYWNTGIYIARVNYLRSRLHEALPIVFRKIDNDDYVFNPEKETEFMAENFPSFPNLSIYRGLLENSKDVYLMKGDFGWADLGTWHSIYDAMQKSKTDNVVIDSDVILENSFGNVIKLPKGRMAVINGLEGCIVAEKDNVLLICKREDSSALIRKYVNEVKITKGDQFV